MVSNGTKQCSYWLHVWSEFGVDESYCFTQQGNTYAELRFVHSEVVWSQWEDAEGKPLSQFPGTNPYYYLDTEPVGYIDYITTFAQMQATKMYPDGPAPWLAQSNFFTAEFTSGGKQFRVTVPLIWDP